MFKTKNYAYDRIQLEEISSEDESRPTSSVTRSPHHPFPHRKKPSVRTFQPKTRCCCQNPLCIKCLYLLVIGLVMVAGMLVVVNILNTNSESGGQSNYHSHPKDPIPTTNDILSASLNKCSKLEVHSVWVQNFPKLLTETAVRLLDVNEDGILDAILGFATGAGGPFYDPDLLCNIYFDGNVPCFGGVLALDGATGEEIWRHWSENEVYALNCNADINRDGIDDCVCSGRMGMFELISGRDGERLWVFDHHSSKVSISNFYTAQFIHDVDKDDVQDILTIHGGDPLRKPGATVKYSGKLMMFSGATGEVITWSTVPDGMESYYSPQVYFDSHGDKVVLFGTGGETHGGALWVIKLEDFINGTMEKAKCLYRDVFKGVMTPALLIDITGDNVLDIVIATFNSTVLAMDGNNYNLLWNFSMPLSETYSTPAAGFYNDDAVPDFLVIFNHGPTYPVYYYSEVTVLDGRTGHPLVEPFIRHSGSIQSSPLTVSIEGTGQDMFLYFASDCLNHEGKSTKFSFTKSTYQSSKSRADFCKVRFNTSSFSRLYAISYSTGGPGSIVYDSLNHRSDEYTHSVNTSLLAAKFLERYPGTAEYVMNRQTQRLGVSNLNEKTKQYPHTSTLPPRRKPYTLSHSETEDTPSSLQGFFGSSIISSNNEEYSTNNFKSGNKMKGGRKDKTPNKHSEKQKKNLHKLVDDISKERAEIDLKHLSIGHSRKSRHAGPHDSGGLQRLIATGTLVPSLHKQEGIDLIFPVYWFYPSETEILTEDQQKCVDKKMENEGDRMNVNSKYYGMDHDAYDVAVENECKGNATNSTAKHENLILTNALEMYPFNIHMGEMTVYRLHLSCSCSLPPCTRILPFRQQGWPSYLGARANSIFVRRRNEGRQEAVKEKSYTIPLS